MLAPSSHAQSQLESEEKLPATSFMKNLHLPLVQAKAQLGFLNFVVEPLWNYLGAIFPEIKERHKAVVDRYSLYWLYWYKSTYSDAPGASAGSTKSISSASTNGKDYVIASRKKRRVRREKRRVRTEQADSDHIAWAAKSS